MSVVDQAKIEMEAAGITGDDARVMVEILEKFFDQWDSGGAVSVMAPVLQRLIAAKPLGPLTGADSEWGDVGEGPDGKTVWQNKRCSSVFRTQCSDGSWLAYDIDRQPDPVVQTETPAQADHPWAACAITFPYTPGGEVGDPVVTLG